MVTPAAPLLVPAPSVPVASQVRRRCRNDDEMSYTGFNSGVASGTDIALARLVRLNWMNYVIVEITEEFG